VSALILGLGPPNAPLEMSPDAFRALVHTQRAHAHAAQELAGKQHLDAQIEAELPVGQLSLGADGDDSTGIGDRPGGGFKTDSPVSGGTASSAADRPDLVDYRSEIADTLRQIGSARSPAGGSSFTATRK
jgi:hypothetical protein